MVSSLCRRPKFIKTGVNQLKKNTFTADNSTDNKFMRTHFDELMVKKTVEELTEFIDNFDRYSPEAITAAINELKVRGKDFSDEELKSLSERIEKKKEIEDEESLFGSAKTMRKNVVTDPNAPLLYSKVAIMVFSTIFTVIFGAILLSINIDNKIQKIKVIGFGILFTTLAILIGNLVPQSTIYVYFINGMGGYFLISDFWKRYIGRETKYRTKQIWIPLTISIIITSLLIIAMIYGK